ncbi:hypothetical protein QMP25_08035 [Enterocloster clostridioformis]
MILRPARGLERNPPTMECEKRCISTRTNEGKQGKASTEYQYPVKRRGQ